MVTVMEPAARRVIVVPLLVVDRDPHFGGIAVVHAIAAAVVFLSPEVLRIIHVRVVVKSIPVRVSAPPQVWP